MEKGSSGGPIPSTTFVQTDANTFKELVQRLTGPHDDCLHHASSTLRSSSGASQTPASSPPSPKPVGGVRKPAFKPPQERRQGSRSKLTILRPNPLLHAAESSFLASPGMLSPSSPSYSISTPLMSPSCGLSNLLISDRESTTPAALALNKDEEEKAIKEKQFYLHPSPRTGPRNAEPELLPLFPLTSMKK